MILFSVLLSKGSTHKCQLNTLMLMSKNLTPLDVMEVTLPGLRPPSGRGIGPLFTSGPDGSPPHTIDWVGDVL